MREKGKATHSAKRLFAEFWESTIFELSMFGVLTGSLL